MFRFLTSSFQNIAAVGIILFTFSGVASAATISNTVSVGPGSCGSQVPETASSSGSIELEATKGGQGCQADSRAYANLGVVGVGGSIESQANIANTTHVLSSFAETKIGGIELSPATGFTFASLQAIHGNFISVGVNAEFTGDLAAEVASFSSNQRSASASLSAFVEIQGSSGPKKSATSSGSFSVNSLLGDNGNRAVSAGLTPFVVTNITDTFSVTFRLNGSAFTSGFFDSIAAAEFNGLNSLGFSSTGPAFLVPNGFTVNAPELNIFDNRWADPRIDTTPVPLPAGLPLLLGALGFLGVVRDRQKRKSS